MERFMFLWDELDDLAWACRHMAGAAADELGTALHTGVQATLACWTAFLALVGLKFTA